MDFYSFRKVKTSYFFVIKYDYRYIYSIGFFIKIAVNPFPISFLVILVVVSFFIGYNIKQIDDGINWMSLSSFKGAILMNITIYYGNHEDKTIHTMDCHVDIDLDDEDMVALTEAR